MAPAAPTLLLVLLLASLAPGQRQRRPPALESLFEKIKIQENFDLQQFSGKWFLVGVASKCDYLREYNHQLEATAMAVSASEGKSLAISTFRKLDGVCWEIKQQYHSTKAQGRFLLKSRGSNVDVVVGETDYSSYAILYYQKLRKISIKLFGRSVRVSDAIVGKFEQRITEMNMSEDFTYYFPTYGFCESADQFHLLDDPTVVLAMCSPLPCSITVPFSMAPAIGSPSATRDSRIMRLCYFDSKSQNSSGFPKVSHNTPREESQSA
ncbi:complement component C8 gamma chain [Gopherus flavomarginatus]|uniref:complement component C8 gamma chain n=1 Tax=Gopherus flavomarginatus TaxID=286002 RepID=UPI0021CC2F53|nr:complement component C8 gamma chain [Gopherus flavomarginatus]